MHGRLVFRAGVAIFAVMVRYSFEVIRWWCAYDRPCTSDIYEARSVGVFLRWRDQDSEFRHYRRGKYHFFSYGNCEINSSLDWGAGDLNDYERYLYQLLE